MYEIISNDLVKNGRQNEDTFGMDDEDWNVYRTIVRFSSKPHLLLVSLFSRVSQMVEKDQIVREKKLNCVRL